MAQDTRQLLEAKVRDCLRMAQRRPCFLGFLDESQRAQCQDLLKWEKGTSFLFWGGYDQAERTMLGFFPDYLEPSAQEFPLEAVTFRYRAGDKLSHRDFLGSFMALGVERDVLGDIRVRAGTLLVVMLGLGDMNVSSYLMVEQVKHTFNNEQHLMELKMRGGTFVT